MAGIQETYVTMTNSQLNELLNNVRMVETSTDRTKKRFKTQTKKAIEQIKSETSRELAAQKDVLNRELAAQRSRYENEMAMIRKTAADAISRISKIEETVDRHEKHAQYWIEQTNGLIDDIIQFRHELFAPGELVKIKGEISNAASDMQAKAFQSAMITGRTAFQNASNLKIRVISAENEWNQVCALWQQELAYVVSDFAESEGLFYEIDTTEGREKIPAALDYWTDGKFQIAKSHLEKLRAEMSDINNMSIENIHCGLRELDLLSDELSVIQKIGRENVMLSYNRYIQGCFFSGILSDNFAMTDCEGDYEGLEMRASYVGIYKNPLTADTIVIKIQPVPDGVGIMSSNKLEIHYITASNNEEQRRQWTNLIEGELKKQMFDVGVFSDRKGYEDRPSDQLQMADIEWVRQKQISV
jgi:hypothetical protein